MKTKLDVLTSLKDALEAGKNPTRDEWDELFPDREEDDDYPRSMMAVSASEGWVGSVFHLFDAVFPGWHYTIKKLPTNEVQVWIKSAYNIRQLGISAKHKCLPRAFLVAIIKCLIKKEIGCEKPRRT